MNKKLIALVLAFTLVFSSVPVAFADTAIPADAQAAKDLGMLKGADGGVTIDYVNTTPTRLQAAVLFLRLKGLEQTALSYTGTTNFADANQVQWAEGRNLMAYLNANPELGFEGIGNNKFNPNATIDAASYYKVMLTALGYKQGTDFQWENLITFAASKNLTKVANDTNFVVGDVATATIEALKAEVKGGTKTLVASLVEAGVINADAAAAAGLLVKGVNSVVANSAKSFKVTFNSPVADTAAVKFAVARGTVAATVTTTWNEAKTEATLTAAAKLPEAVYTVTVTEGTTEMAKKNIEITKEVVKSVEYSATEILRMNDISGVLGFKVLNQYGEDVTNAALGRSLDFVVSTNKDEKADFKAGVLTVTHGDNTTLLNQLKDLQTVVVTVRDTATGFVQTNNFTVSKSVGVVSDIKLLGIVDENGKPVDFSYDQSKTYYLNYEAIDALGNKTTNYDALTAELYGQKVLDVKSSNENLVKVVVDKDPSDNTKLVYRLELVGSAPTYDTPVTFLAVAPYSGKSSNFTTTLARKAAVETFKMQTPAETVSVNKAVEIPFEAFDQAGNAVTKYDDLVGKINFSQASTVIDFVKQADGSAKLFAKFANKQTYYVTATVNGSLTGSFSQISVDVKDQAVATTIDALRHTSAYMTDGTWADLRVSNFVIRDQYDRTMSLRSDALASNYAIKVTSSDSDIIAVNDGTTATISGEQKITFKGGADAGTATITYELIDTADGNKVIDSATTVAYNVDKKDIKSVELTVSENPVYMVQNNDVMNTIAAADSEDLANEPTFVGKTASGMTVRLTGEWFTLTNNKFTADTNGYVQADGAFGTDATASTVLTGYFQGTNGVLTASATINASNAEAVVQTVAASYSNSARRAGDISVTNDVVDVKEADFATLFGSKSILEYATDGTASANKAPVYFTVDTQYGDYVTNRVIVTPKTGNTGAITVDATTGAITVDTGVVAGDEFTVTALAVNGKSKVVRIRIVE